MNNKTIYFIGGVIWALVSSRKAYAPNINTSIDNSIPNVEPIDCRGTKPPCPEGCKKFQKNSGALKVYHRPVCLSLEDYDKATKRQKAKDNRYLSNIFDLSQFNKI